MKILIQLLVISFTAIAFDPALACNKSEPSMEELSEKAGIKIVGPILVSEITRDINERRKSLDLALITEEESIKEFKKKVEFGDKIYYFEESVRGHFMSGYILERNGCAVEFLPRAVS